MSDLDIITLTTERHAANDLKFIAALEDLCDAGFDIHDDNTHAWGLVYVEDVRDLIEQWRAAL